MLLVRIALTVAGGVLVLSVIRAVFDRQAPPRPATVLRERPFALPSHYNRLAAYSRVSLN